MRALVVSLLVVSLIAVGANAGVRYVAKRGILGGHGQSDGVELSSGGGLGDLGGADSSAKYLPPVSLNHHHSVPSHPAPSYGPPSSVSTLSVSVPAPNYGVPASDPVPVYSIPISEPAPSHSLSAKEPTPSYSAPLSVPSGLSTSVSSGYGAPVAASVPSFSSHDSAPVPTYGAPSLPKAPMYEATVAAPSLSLSSHSVGSGLGSGLNSGYSHGLGSELSSGLNSGNSHGLDSGLSSGLNSGYSNEVSSGLGSGLGSGLNSGYSHGLSSGLDSGLSHGLNLGSNSVPSSTYGSPKTLVESAPSVDISFNSASFPSKSYGVPFTDYSGSSQSAGLSLDVPSKSDGLSSIDLHSSGHGGQFSVGSIGGGSSSLNLASSSSYGAPLEVAQDTHNEGYDYPVPAKKLHF